MSNWPVNKGAENLKEYNFNIGERKEVGFDVVKEYPNDDVGMFYTEEVKSPWKRCFKEIKWDSFGDVSEVSHTFIH